MTSEFIPARQKLERAEYHIEQIAKAIEEYSKLNPQHSIEKSVDGYQVVEIYRTVAPPRHLPLVVGDAIHNLRTALDAAAAAAVRAGGGNDRSVYFPFCDQPEYLEEMIKKRNFHRARPEAVELVRKLRPYKNGNILLRAVHDMDIEDKHTGILLQISYINTPGIGIGMADDKIGLLGGGSTILSENLKARQGKFPIPVKYCFHHMSALSDHEVVQTLRDILGEFRKIVDEFESCCTGSVSK
jgi:hypothetical protein